MFVLDVDTVTLDESVLDDEPHCEFRHSRTACSNEVTHVVTGCRGLILACTNAAELKKKQILDGKTFCKCGKAAEDCWKVVPI